ncbi:Glycosyl transferases group 1 [Actinokineospora alba]|uniref:Glycosyl transferases group 1 n=1 Tax=Actinokineospora alba TaxID=504798 RepID=A0A1H0W9X3_9PSEU|nr:glycosyltransferase family 4 protein [Actinokineospora alba]TDP66193.1 glycosyl transferase family 1 [Actinokineospora alba]SDJ42565.1 Glycosyl transferases group 1 [Actinokineospora alba]SDP87504.1 Glycosyl transferases group 1 [Actinokineospora alba]
MGDPRPRRVLGCTVVAKFALPAAEVLAQSYLEHHRDHGFVIVVTDDDEPVLRVGPAGCRALGARGLLSDEAEFFRMATAYTADELVDAVKPFVLRALLADNDAVVCLDAMTRVFAPFTEAADHALDHGIVLTPHFLAPFPADGREPGHEVLEPLGAFDTRFIAVGREAQPFLDFWAERSRLGSAAPKPGRVSRNQASLDLVPALFRHTVLRDPGFAVAYWNLHDRKLATDGDVLTADGKPVRFIHFDGYSTKSPWLLTTRLPSRPRILLSELPVLRAVCDDYRDALIAAGHTERLRDDYRFGTFGFGTKLTPAMRSLFRHEWSRFARRELAPTPFATTKPKLPPHPFGDDAGDEFRRWLSSPATPAERSAGFNRLTTWVWGKRKDLQVAFPQPFSASAEGFRGWCRDHGTREARLPEWALPGDPAARVAPVDELGVNIAGYLTAELGLGEMGRIVLKAVEAAQIPVVSVVEEESLNGNVRTGLDHPETAGAPRFPVSILAVNADYTQLILDNHPDVGGGRYVIGLWAWELEDFPSTLHNAFGLVDEIWTVSDFCRTSIAQHTSVPVRTIPVPVIAPATNHRPERAPGDPVQFLFVFDFNSTGQRKNPWGAVTAFQRAFPNRSDVRLVIKATNGHLHAGAVERLRDVIGADDRVELMERYLSVEELDSLYADSHAYVSLHRSEGFGLTVAEAMARGMAVIATDYSSTTEFLDETVAWPIPYRMTDVGPGWLPYHAEGRWADPDLDAAAEAMRHIADDPAEAKRRGEAAREHILRTRSLDTAAQWMRDRITAAHEAWRLGERETVARPHVTDPLAQAHRILHSTPDAGAPSRLPLAPAMRKVVLRAMAHYDAHQRKVVGAVLTAVGEAVKDLNTRFTRTTAAQANRMEAIEAESAKRIDALADRIERIERSVRRNEEP